MPDHREYLVAFVCAVVAYFLYQQHAENVSLRKTVDQLSHQTTKLTLNMDTLKERHSDLKRALNDVDARVKDTEGKMRKLVAEDEELRKKIVNFQGEMDNLRRSSDRNPLYDIFSRFLGYFTGWSRRLLE